jgi:hypothetical protein
MDNAATGRLATDGRWYVCMASIVPGLTALKVVFDEVVNIT